MSLCCHILALRYLEGNEEGEVCCLVSLWRSGGVMVPGEVWPQEVLVLHVGLPHLGGITSNPQAVPPHSVSPGLLVLQVRSYGPNQK